MFEDHHELAEKNLDFAFNHCHRNSIQNKKCILRYLVPIKLYRGRLPTPYRKYGDSENIDVPLSQFLTLHYSYSARKIWIRRIQASCGRD
jgi:hypothetical protein